MKCEKKKGWYCELFNSKCDGPNDCCSDFIQADVVSDSSRISGSVEDAPPGQVSCELCGSQNPPQRCHDDRAGEDYHKCGDCGAVLD